MYIPPSVYHTREHYNNSSSLLRYCRFSSFFCKLAIIYHLLFGKLLPQVPIHASLFLFHYITITTFCLDVVVVVVAVDDRMIYLPLTIIIVANLLILLFASSSSSLSISFKEVNGYPMFMSIHPCTPLSLLLSSIISSKQR